MVIVIPCYNEYNRINKQAYLDFLTKNNNCTIVFSDDGSTDETQKILKEIQNEFKNNVRIYRLNENKGKAEAIREAIIYSYNSDLKFHKIAYIDADLSVSLEETLAISKTLNNITLFAFGSRILKIDTDIQRKKFRHFSGRFVATIISNLLGVSIYDTQCGCKIFDKKIAEKIFEEPFISRWLFDVEIFFRIIKLYSKKELKLMSKEIPLKKWIDIDDSKVKISYFFSMWKDIYLINKKYNEKNK